MDKHKPKYSVWKYKKAIRSNYDRLQQFIDSTAIRIKLFEKSRISMSENEELCHAMDTGPTHGSQKLLNILLMKKDEECFAEFVDVLLKSNSESQKLLGRDMETVLSSDPCEDIEGLKRKLQEKYTSKNWTVQQQVPDEPFRMDVSNDKQMLFYTNEAVCLDERKYSHDFRYSTNVTPKYIPHKFPKIINVLNKAKDQVIFKKRPHEKNLSCPNLSQLEGNCSALNQGLISGHSSIGTMVLSSPIRTPQPTETPFVFQHDQQSDIQTRLIVCSGDAGMGKTTLSKRFPYLWAANQNPYIAHYKLVFTIMLKFVDYKKPVVDILQENGCLTDSHYEFLHEILCKPEIAQNVLFIIDGCDEITMDKETEIWKLISGQLYPGLNVFVTTRPDTDTFEELHYLHPKVKVKITGLDHASIEKFIQAFLHGQENDISFPLNQCVKHHFHFNILSSPLYITMFCLMFHEQFGRDANFTKKKMPSSNTDILSAFMEVMIKRGMRRCSGKIGKTMCASEIKFGLSPLDEDSVIPLMLKHNLYFVGKLSYECLLQNKYDFSNQDLNKYLLDKDILASMGLFCSHETNAGFFFKHKLIQEYLAAIYIAFEKFRLKSLCDYIDAAALENPKPNMSKLFNQLQYPIQLACGVSKQFYFELIDKCKNVTSLKREEFNPCSIQIQYEMSLCYEAASQLKNTEDVQKIYSVMENYLLKTPIDDLPWCGIKICSPYHKHCIISACSKFTKATTKELLNQWFNINTDIGIYPDEFGSENRPARILGNREDFYGGIDNRVMEHVSLDHGIGLVCLSLLSKFHFPDVSDLSIKGESGVIDLHKIIVTFPRLKNLDLKIKFGNETLHDTELNNKRMDGSIGKGITSFRYRGSTHMKFPILSVKCLLAQDNLQELSVHGSDILSNLSKVDDLDSSHWCNLHTLEMKWCNINECNTRTLVKILKWMTSLRTLNLAENRHMDINDFCINGLSNLTKLNKLILSGVGFNLENTDKLCKALECTKHLNFLDLSNNAKMDMEALCACIVESTKQIRELRLCRSFYDNDNCSKCSTMKFITKLPEMYNLETLGLCSVDIVRHVGDLSRELISRNRRGGKAILVEIEEEEWSYKSTFSMNQKRSLNYSNVSIAELSPK